MSTRSVIAAQLSDGKVKAIYCHYDGYPDHVGRILQEHYTDQEKIDALIALGDLSSLDVEITKPEGHTWKDPVEGYTVAYHRDRGEELSITDLTVDKYCVESFKLAINDTFGSVDYLYIWTAKEEKWCCVKGHG